jgi:hypothetical protein
LEAESRDTTPQVRGDACPSFQVTVLHNVGWGRFWAYRPGDALDRVFELTVTANSPEAACEIVFAVCNSAPGELFCDHRYAEVVSEYRAARLRSLSVGDVLIVRRAEGDGDGGRAFACAAVGFDALPTLPGHPDTLGRTS